MGRFTFKRQEAKVMDNEDYLNYMWNSLTLEQKKNCLDAYSSYVSIGHKLDELKRMIDKPKMRESVSQDDKRRKE